MASKKRKPPQKMTTRSYRSRGVNVEISEAKNRVELKLDGKPIHIGVVDGKFHSQLANQFTEFGSVEDVVETLLANEGRTWTLHGHLCDERCREGDHHHDDGPSHGLDHHHGEGGEQ